MILVGVPSCGYFLALGSDVLFNGNRSWQHHRPDWTRKYVKLRPKAYTKIPRPLFYILLGSRCV